jgi:hypothetical protein
MGRETEQFNELLRMLPEGWEAKAKELGAFCRAREIKTPADLLRMILLYLTEGRSFGGTSALLNLSTEVEMSKVAVFKRMRGSAAWLRWLCENIYRGAGLLTEKPQWLGNRNVILIDGSETVTSGHERKMYMLHYSIDLFTLTAREFQVTKQSTGEKLLNFKEIGPDDIVIADRAYGNKPGVSYLTERGAGFVLRIQGRGPGNALYTMKQEKINLFEELSALQDGEITDIPGYCVINDRYEKVRICAMRKDASSERAGLKRLTKTNQRKRGGKEVSREQQLNNKYIILATSLDGEVSAEQVLELYRARWQIEVAFKRLKSLFQYNELPAKQPAGAFAWFYGKLLLAALCETMVNTGRFSPCGNRRGTEAAS